MHVALDKSPALNLSSVPRAPIHALYVHIPFCFHKCHYCDFYSITRQTPQRMSRFVDLILREADLWLDARADQPAAPRTVFFGGGTPSLLPRAEMARLISGLRQRFDFSQCDEFTVEANPATVDLDYCRMLHESGANRLSFGAQSFDRSELALLERHHDPDDVPRSLEIARAAGFTRVNFDLIYAIPGQMLDNWLRSLQSALSLGTDHLSCYGLTYEPNTPMAVRKRLGQFQSAPAELELQMMRVTREQLIAAGLPPYEISNYARPGQECRHNLNYWTGGNYLALGPSAASHVEGWRWRNAPHLGEWESAVSGNRIPSIEAEHLSPKHRAAELAMLMLRLSRGITLSDFRSRTGCDAADLFAAEIERLQELSLLECDTNAIRLTDAGIEVADSVAAEFLSH